MKLSGWGQSVVEQHKEPFHHPTIGIILCKDKDRMIVEYMLETNESPIGMATFNRYENLPEEYAKYLPSEEKIIQHLAKLGFGGEE
jgi:hypothetical protein